MPIEPELRWLYPIDWRELSATIRFGRAAGRCERCRRPHGAWVWHLGDGRWWDAAAATWRNGCGRALAGLGPVPLGAGLPPDELECTRVVLAAAHRDHDPTHNKPRNLLALCQRCHLNHDRLEHLRRRRLAHLARHAVGDLFLGPYRPAGGAAGPCAPRRAGGVRERPGATVRPQPPRLLSELLARERAPGAAEHDVNHLM